MNFESAYSYDERTLFFDFVQERSKKWKKDYLLPNR